MKYTEKIHARNLLAILSDTSPCSQCPPVYGNTFLGTDNYCRVCWQFIGYNFYNSCPCIELGRREAIKRTWLALEAKGYLK